ncbi:MAG: hypothetical protein AAGG44_18550 [Planctomycetota bacterium]
MFLYAGAIRPEPGREDLTVTNLVTTRANSGLVGYEDLNTQMRSRDASAQQLRVLQGEAAGEQVVAVYIEGKAGEDVSDATAEVASDEEASGDEAPAATPAAKPIRAVYVADVDYMHPFFSENRKRPEQYEEIDLRVQNITFVLNVVDVLAGEEDYPTIRSHEPEHITLGLFEDQAEQYRQEAFETQQLSQEEYNKAKTAAEEEMEQKVAEYRDRLAKLDADGATTEQKRAERLKIQQQLQIMTQVMQRKLDVKLQALGTARDAAVKDSRRESESMILKLQNQYKMLAIFLPPIPPLLVGAGVFVTRRVREREGIAKTRLK